MKAVLSIFLMLQIVFSSMSVTINMHYCLGELSDIAIFDDAEVCSFEKYFGTITPEDGVAITNKSCCGSEHYVINGQNHNTTLKSETAQTLSLGEYRFAQNKITQNYNGRLSTFYLLNPPLVEPPLFLRVQSFRL